MIFYRKSSPLEVAHFTYHSGQVRDMPPEHARLLKAHGLGDFVIRTQCNPYFPQRQVFDLTHNSALIDALQAVVHAPIHYVMEIHPPEKDKKKRTKDQRSVLDELLGKIARERKHHGKKYPPAVWHQLFMHEYARNAKSHEEQKTVQFFRESIPTLCGMGFIQLVPQLRDDTESIKFSLFIQSIHQWLLENPPAPNARPIKMSAPCKCH